MASQPTSPLQSVFVFLLKASSPEPKATAAPKEAADPESPDEVFGKDVKNTPLVGIYMQTNK